MNIEIQDPPSTGADVTASVSEAAAVTISLREDLAAEKELNQRLVADFENFKRRTRQESDARATAQKEAFIHELGASWKTGAPSRPPSGQTAGASGRRETGGEGYEFRFEGTGFSDFF